MSQPKSFTDATGKRRRLDPLVPAGEIRWLVNREHVGATDDDIREMILSRATGWRDRLRAQAAELAVAHHRANQALYGRVVRGELGL